MKYFFRTFLTVITVFFGVNVVQAQISFPEFSLSNTPTEDSLLISNTPNISEELASIKTPLFRDMLILQNQINLLEGLIERQSELKSISLNYKRMGVPFKQPSPSRDICKQLPINVLCLLSYPDLQVNRDILKDSKKRYEEKQKNKIAEMLSQIEQLDYSDNEVDLKSVVSPVEVETYAWSDIRCLNNDCSALLINNLDSADRIRVKENQKIDEKNIVITSITKSSVGALIDGKKTEILPLPISGASITKPSKPEEKERIADLLRTNLGAISNDVIAPQASEASIPEIDLGGMLGPTGLF